MFDKFSLGWKNWLKTVETGPLEKTLEFQEIVVTTMDTIRYRFLFDLLVSHGKHVLFGGPTGTGKTAGGLLKTGTRLTLRLLLFLLLNLPLLLLLFLSSSCSSSVSSSSSSSFSSSSCSSSSSTSSSFLLLATST